MVNLSHSMLDLRTLFIYFLITFAFCQRARTELQRDYDFIDKILNKYQNHSNPDEALVNI